MQGTSLQQTSIEDSCMIFEEDGAPSKIEDCIADNLLSNKHLKFLRIGDMIKETTVKSKNGSDLNHYTVPLNKDISRWYALRSPFIIRKMAEIKNAISLQSLSDIHKKTVELSF